MPLGEIAALLGIAKSSVSRWVHDVELTPHQQALLHARHPRYTAQLRGQAARSRAARAKRAAAQEHGRELARRGDPLHAQGCMLYWAEGAKHRNTLAFTNSDPDMVALFLRFLQKCYGVDHEDVALVVNCHVPMPKAVEPVVTWWLDRLGLPAGCARAPTVNHVSRASGGVAATCCRTAQPGSSSTRCPIVQSIYGALQEYAGIERPEWLDLRAR